MPTSQQAGPLLHRAKGDHADCKVKALCLSSKELVMAWQVHTSSIKLLTARHRSFW